MLKKFARWMLIWGLLFATVAAQAPMPAQARPLGAVTTVTQCNDAGLRSALSSFDTIYFNCPSNPAVITLTGGQLNITRNTIIDGGGRVVLDGQGTHRIMELAPYMELLLRNITLQNGHAVAGDHNLRPGQGGAVLVGTWADVTFQNVRFLNNRADATGSMGDGTSQICEGGGAVHLNGFNYAEVFDSTFVGNSAQNGGAINNLTADLVVSNSTFENNVSTHARPSDPCGGGGAIYIDGAGNTNQGGTQTVSITGSVFRGNRTDRKGGAVFMFMYSNTEGRSRGDLVTIENSTFESNRSEAPNPGEHGQGGGGAIDYQGSVTGGAMKLIIRNSTVNNNHADHLGGGIWAENAAMELHNVTIVGNEAKNAKAGLPYNLGAGGGLVIGNGSAYTFDGTRLIHVTIAGNSANFRGGGITGWGNTPPSGVRMGNSIVANNTAGLANNCFNTFTNLGGNVQYPSKNSGDVDCTSGITFGNPSFGTFGNNGGRTQTLQINSGSAARDRGNTQVCTGWTVLDQRRFGRSGACDSGAFEYGGVALRPAGYFPFVRR